MNFRSSSIWFTAGGFALGIAGVVLAISFWGWLHPESPETVSRSETVRNVALIIGGILAFLFAWWRAVVAERQANAAQGQVETAQRQADTAHQSLLNDRYQRGAEMLGSEVLAVRLGGIYTLQELAGERPKEYHIQVVRLLCAFVRNPTGAERRIQEGEIPSGESTQVGTPREDIQAAVSAIGTRSSHSREIERAANFALDLRGAHLSGASMQGLNFSSADLRGALFMYADLTEAVLSGCLLHQANLYHATLDGADLSGAHIERARLARCQARQAVFSRARLLASDLSRSSLQLADFSQAQIDSTTFFESTLEDANFSGARVQIRGIPESEDFQISGLWFTCLTQDQLDSARSDPNNPPTIADGTVDPISGDPLEWRGRPLGLARGLNSIPSARRFG